MAIIAGGLYIGVQAHDKLPLKDLLPGQPAGSGKEGAVTLVAHRGSGSKEEPSFRKRDARRAEARDDEAEAGHSHGPEHSERDTPEEGSELPAETLDPTGPQPPPPAAASVDGSMAPPADLRPPSPIGETLKPSVQVRPSTAQVAPMPAVEVDRGTGRRREVALTFDAGSDYRPAKQILQALAAEGAQSTFFLTGEWVQKNPKTTRRIADEGHEIGNHSWDHANFTRLSDDAIREQLRRTEEAIREAASRSSRPYFRPPLGARDRRVLKTVGDEGFMTIYWTLDSRDSVDAGITAAQIRDRVLQKAAPGSIVLLHCGSQATADALPDILKALKAQGLKPVTIGQLLSP